MPNLRKSGHLGIYTNDVWFYVRHGGKWHRFETVDEAKAFRSSRGLRLKKASSGTRRRPRPPASGWVYFIAPLDGGLIKIGFSRSEPHIRMAALQSGSPLELEIISCRRGTMADEQDLHFRFRHLRRHGEWFEPAPELLLEADLLPGERRHPGLADLLGVGSHPSQPTTKEDH